MRKLLEDYKLVSAERALLETHVELLVTALVEAIDRCRACGAWTRTCRECQKGLALIKRVELEGR